MSVPVKLLLVEDSLHDAELVLHELKRAGFQPEFQRVETEADFLRALQSSPELVISDYSLPQFDGLRAVRLLRERKTETPFILLSGTVGEETAVEAMKHGATDYLLKDRIARLGTAVQHALDQTRLREERRIAKTIQAELAHRIESFLRALGEIVYDHDVTGATIKWEGDTAKCLGWSHEELGNSIRGWSERVHPNDLARVTAQLETLSIEPLVVSEYRFRHRDGHYSWVFDRGVISRDNAGRITRVIGIMRDISDRKRAEEVLRENEERFRQLAENIQEVFWMTDVAKSQVIYISPGYEKIWGRTCASLYQSPGVWFDAIHIEDRDRIREALLNKQSAGTYDEEYRIVRPDGSIRWIRDRAFPVRNASGQVYRIVGIAQDVTRERELESQFRQVQKMEAVGLLAGGVAHDFNNLLTVIRGSSDLLLSSHKLSQTETRELLQQIIATADRAANLTRQLLVFSRKQTLQSRTLSLNELLENLTKLLRRIIGEDIRLHCDYAAELPMVQADPNMLEQVVMNLVVNARDAMPRGGELTLRTSVENRQGLFRQDWTTNDTAIHACLSICDTGTGIPKEILPRIFEPFFTTKEAGKGTGLGLATVYSIVQQHRGWIEVKSDVGVGTTFQIGIPAAVKRRESQPATATKLDTQQLRGTETVLLVEDEISVRRLIRNILERHGYQVLDADSGKAALALWRNHAPRIHLVLTDMVMPDGISGLMLAEQLSKDRPELKIIFSSGYSPELSLRNFALPRGSRYLPKPFSPQILLQTVREYLDGTTPETNDSAGF